MLNMAIECVNRLNLNQIVNVLNAHFIEITIRNFPRRNGDTQNGRNVRIFGPLFADVQTEV